MTAFSLSNDDRFGGNTLLNNSRSTILFAPGVTVTGTAGNDIITPSQTVPGQPLPGVDDDVIHGLAGNDTIDGGAGADQMYGGTGDDVFYVDNAGDRVFEAQGQAQGQDRVFASVSFNLAGQFIERLTLTGTANINATGNAQANFLEGNAGNNILDGKGGADRMEGGTGDDTYHVDNAFDQIFEKTDEGYDHVISSVSFNSDGKGSIEAITLTGTGDTAALGNGLANVLTGNSGNNQLFGFGGADVMRGGAGNDRYYVDDIGDIVDETDGAGGDAGGVDTVNIEFDTSGSFSLTGLAANVENVSVFSDDYRAVIDVTGNDLDNVLSARFNSPVVFDGRGGDDELIGGFGNDRLFGGDGNDDLSGDSGHDQLHGGNGNDVLEGGFGNDQLHGGAGDDVIHGSRGYDQLYGNGDADVFSFGGGSSLASINTIRDFDQAEGDRIDVRTTGQAGAIAFNGEVDPDFTLTAGAALGGDDLEPGYTRLWSYREGDTTYLIGDTNDNRTLDTTDLVVALTGATAPLTLTESDFVSGLFGALG